MAEIKLRRLIINRRSDICEELARVGVDNDSYPIFTGKAINLTLRIDGLSCAQANVLKQTALICGADAAIPRNAYHGGRSRTYPLILFANRRELEKIERRLVEQSWMEKVRVKLRAVLTEPAAPVLKIRGKKLSFNRTHIMGIVNATPDSFYRASSHTAVSIIERVVAEMAEEGADFIDIGAESTRPGSMPVDEKEEMRRMKMILPTVMKRTRVPVSVDTYKAKVAALAIDHGAAMINDISGLRFDRAMAGLIARNRVSLVIMHMRGKPKTMQRDPRYRDLMSELRDFFEERIEHAVRSGIERERVLIDPGLGFGKRLDDNYAIIERLAELKDLDRPILVGHSRKSFVGKPFDLPPEGRLEGTLALGSLLIAHGASILRVHDVLETKRTAQLVDRIVR